MEPQPLRNELNELAQIISENEIILLENNPPLCCPNAPKKPFLTPAQKRILRGRTGSPYNL